MLHAVDLRKGYRSGSTRFGRKGQAFAAVDGVSISVAQGETVAVVGESGAGKSTLGRLVLRLIEPDSGSVYVDNEDVLALDARRLRTFRRKMQLIFQDPYSSLNPKMTIGQAVAEPLRLHTALNRRERDARVADLLAQVGIRPDQIQRYPREMSGGQLTRVGIARALATSPRLLVCDEPTAALDVSIQGQVLNLLAEMQRANLVAYLFISHDLTLVRSFADRVAVMFAGRIVEEAPTSLLFAAPRHPYTQTLLFASPSIEPGERRLLSAPNAPLRTDHDGSWNGCAYYRRCQNASSLCRTGTPALQPAASGGRFACHHPLPGSDFESRSVANVISEAPVTLRRPRLASQQLGVEGKKR